MSKPGFQFIGQVVTIGQMDEDDAAPAVGTPHIVIEGDGGRRIIISGMSEDDCRACSMLFLSGDAIVTVEGAE